MPAKKTAALEMLLQLGNTKGMCLQWASMENSVQIWEKRPPTSECSNFAAVTNEEKRPGRKADLNSFLHCSLYLESPSSAPWGRSPLA